MKKMPLILIPGFGANQEIWKHQVDHLAEIVQPQVILLERQSSRLEMVKEVLARAPARFAIAGHSMGGWVAQAVAAEAPERISSLILINTWASHSPEMIAGQMASLQMIEEGKQNEVLAYLKSLLVYPEHQRLLTPIEKMLSRSSAHVLCNQLRAMNSDYATLPLLGKISSPTLVIHGRQDALFPLEEALALSQAIAQSRLALIEECGHMAPMEQPQATTACMRLWLESTL